MPGAFASSLGRRGAGGMRMLFQHDPASRSACGTELSEDRTRLFVRGRLIGRRAAGARAAGADRAHGALDGLSIGFRTVRARRDEARRRRGGILEVDLWEISIVTFPMHAAARASTAVEGWRARRRRGTPRH